MDDDPSSHGEAGGDEKRGHKGDAVCWGVSFSSFLLCLCVYYFLSAFSLPSKVLMGAPDGTMASILEK